jgi:hypothetical protein
MKHHKYCAIEDRDHLGACFDATHNPLPDDGVAVTDELLTRVASRAQNIADRAVSIHDATYGDTPWGYSQSGMPVDAIVKLERPDNFSISPEGLPNNIETNQYMTAIGKLQPLMVNPPLEAVATIRDSGETDWRPDGPRIEVAYSDETGVKIELEMTITEEMKPYYDADMVLQQLTSKLGALAGDVTYAKNVHERDDR